MVYNLIFTTLMIKLLIRSSYEMHQVVMSSCAKYLKILILEIVLWVNLFNGKLIYNIYSSKLNMYKTLLVSTVCFEM